MFRLLISGVLVLSASLQAQEWGAAGNSGGNGNPLGKGILDPVNVQPLSMLGKQASQILKGIPYLCKTPQDFDLVASTQLLGAYKNRRLDPKKRLSVEQLNQMVVDAAMSEGKDCFVWREDQNKNKYLASPKGDTLNFDEQVQYNVYRYRSETYRALTLKVNDSFKDVSPAVIEFIRGSSYSGKLYYFDPVPPDTDSASDPSMPIPPDSSY